MKIVTGLFASIETGTTQAGAAVRDACAGRLAEIRIQFDNFDGRSGSVEARDADGNVLHALSMSSFVASIPPFVPDARVLSERGLHAVKELTPGTHVMTRDNGLQPVQQVISRSFDWRALGLNSLLRPIKIAPGGLGGGMPAAEILLSPAQLLSVSLPGTAKAGEWLVRAIDLIGQAGVEQASPRTVTYTHVLFAERQFIMVDGFWSECSMQDRSNYLPFGDAAVCRSHSARATVHVAAR